MFPPQEVYGKNPHSITLLFDAEAPSARKVLRTVREAFGEQHSDIETLNTPRYFCLHLYPGGALEVAAWV